MTTEGRVSTNSAPLLFPPVSRVGAYSAAAVAAVALAVGLALALRAFSFGISFAGFLAALVAVLVLAGGGVAAYWAWACLTLRYEVSDGVLRVRWGWLTYEAPAAGFERVVRGREGAEPDVRGLVWPGCAVGEATLGRAGAVRFFSLHRAPSEVLYLIGPAGNLALSPADRNGLIRALQAAGEPPGAGGSARVSIPRALQAPIWGERRLLLIAGAVLGLAALATAIIFSRYAGLADEVVLRFPEDERLGSRSALLAVPVIAWLVAVLNVGLAVAVAHQRVTAATLLLGTVFVQALLVLASVTLV